MVNQKSIEKKNKNIDQNDLKEEIIKWSLKEVENRIKAQERSDNIYDIENRIKAQDEFTDTKINSELEELENQAKKNPNTLDNILYKSKNKWEKTLEKTGINSYIFDKSWELSIEEEINLQKSANKWREQWNQNINNIIEKLPKWMQNIFN